MTSKVQKSRPQEPSKELPLIINNCTDRIFGVANRNGIKMKRICTMCKAELGRVDSEIHTDDIITHGYCDTCANKLMNDFTMPIEDFINCLPEPILVVDGNVVALSANKRARDVLGKDIERIQGFRGGEIIECIHSTEPGGCGRTIHCVGCAIRNTVTDTFRNGKSHLKEPATADIQIDGNLRPVRFLISTQKVKNVVWLRIDDVDAGKKSA